MSELFLEVKKASAKCHRNKHGECSNRFDKCGCECHKIKELQRELDLASQNSIKSHMEILSR